MNEQPSPESSHSDRVAWLMFALTVIICGSFIAAIALHIFH